MPPTERAAEVFYSQTRCTANARTYTRVKSLLAARFVFLPYVMRTHTNSPVLRAVATAVNAWENASIMRARECECASTVPPVWETLGAMSGRTLAGASHACVCACTRIHGSAHIMSQWKTLQRACELTQKPPPI